MVFKIIIVILAILVLNSHAHRPIIHPLDKWDLYGNDLLTLVYKRHPPAHRTTVATEMPRASSGCTDGKINSYCESYPNVTPREPVKNIDDNVYNVENTKRTQGKINLMGLFRSLSRNEIPESEIFESNDYDDKRDSRFTLRKK